MVDAGMALAYRKYSTQYVPNEQKARQAKKGVWAGEFVKPWDWRKDKRLGGTQPQATLDPGCRQCRPTGTRGMPMNVAARSKRDSFGR